MIAKTEPTIQQREYSDRTDLRVTYVYLADTPGSDPDYRVGTKRIRTTDTNLCLRVGGDYSRDDDGTRDEIVTHKIPWHRVEKRIKKSIELGPDDDLEEVDL